MIGDEIKVGYPLGDVPRMVRAAFFRGVVFGLALGLMLGGALCSAGCTDAPDALEDAAPRVVGLGGECAIDEDCLAGLTCAAVGRTDDGRARAHVCTVRCVAESGAAPACGPNDTGACLMYVTPIAPAPICLATCDEFGACEFGDPANYAGRCLCWPGLAYPPAP